VSNLFDALPLLEATTTSRVTLSGEMAQSIPNPNVEGQAYVDDFEGAKEVLSLSEFRHYWTKSSPPVEGTGFYLDAASNPRGRLIWFNPWQETPITDIWNREVRDRDNRTHTLILRIDPDSSAGDPRESWAGVMRPISRGSWDQTRTQFLEIRMKPPGDEGKLLIHLGKISKDIDGDGVLDTEDKIQNDILDDEEDVGLDGWTDEEERANLGSTEADPSGDNWFYDNSTANRNNYEGLNGTQGNAEDPSRGFRPDTEDIDDDNGLDLSNDYFEFVLDFSEDRYLVPNSEYKGWVTYRFPFDSWDDSVRTADWERVEFARLILTDFAMRDSLEIAAMELVSTRWLVQPLADEGGDTTKLEIAVINTEENSSIYQPPPNVAGYYDKVNEVTEKEQSLLLKFNSIRPGDVALAQRILFTGENYAGYSRMQMYVHSTIDDSNSTFIFRMGSDSLNFYQFQTPLYNDAGNTLWDQRNWVDMDLDALTQVKDSLNVLKGETPDTNFLSVGKYAVRGRPKVTNVLYFAVGVSRDSLAENTATGELWLDELRVTEVRRDKGVAKRLSISTAIADIGSFSMNYKNTDAFFRQLTSADRNNLGSGREQSSLSMSGSFNFDKLLPRGWNARIPISYSWSRNETVPRLKSGSDIVITDDERESETTRSYSESFRVSQRFTRKSKSWMWNYLLNAFTSSFSASRTNSKSPTVIMSESENYTATAKYDIRPGKKFVQLLKWTSFIPLVPESFSEMKFGYFPESISFSGDVKRTYSLSLNTQGYRSEVYNRQFTGSGNIRYNLFSSLPLTYQFSTNRDLRDPETLKLSFNPQQFKLGVELSRRQSFSGSYDPKVFKFLTTKVSYKSSYDENADPKRNEEGTLTAKNNATWTFSGSFDSQKLFGTGKKGKDFVALRPFLFTIRLVTNRIDPVKLTYSLADDFQSSGLLDKPNLKFQFGFTKDPGAEIRDVTGGARRFSNNQTRSFNATSGFKFILGSKVTSKYNLRRQKSLTNQVQNSSVNFPDLTVSFSRLERYRIFGWIFQSLTLNSSFSRKTDESLNTNTDEVTKKNVTDGFNPLIGAAITWPRGVKTTIRYETSEGTQQTFTGSSPKQITSNRSITVSNQVQFRSPTGIKIPLFGRLKFQSTLSLNLDISKRFSKSERISLNGTVTPGNESTDLTIAPRASYGFSTNIKGGMQMRWTDREDKRTRKKSHVRQVGIWVEIRF